jgi:hypothetical protein
MRPRDTSPAAWKVYLDIQRRIPPEEKIRQVFEWTRAMRKLAEGGLRDRYPHADDHEIFLRRVRMEFGPELFRRVYGDVL